MSLLSVLLNELVNENRRPNYGNLYDQNFGLGLFTDDLVHPANNLILGPLRSGYLRPWRNLEAGDSGVSTISSKKNEFTVNLDVQQFKPEELKVELTNDFIVVEGKHEERSDQHGFISRQFLRRYKVPEDVDSSALSSSLSSDGVLTLKAPKKAIADSTKGREIAITVTKQPAVKSSTNDPEKKLQQDNKMES